MKPEEGYRKFRGKCREMSEALAAADPTLRLVRGFYSCPLWGTREPHWWCAQSDGTIVDPTREQFPSAGGGLYEEVDGTVECAECGNVVDEKAAVIMGNYATCSDRCACLLVGLPFTTTETSATREKETTDV